MILSRKPASEPAAPPACDCAERVAALESALGALARGLIVRSPSGTLYTPVQNLIAWGLKPDDAKSVVQTAQKEPSR